MKVSVFPTSRRTHSCQRTSLAQLYLYNYSLQLDNEHDNLILKRFVKILI